MVELITIGFELLNGHTLNANARFIGEQLTARGIALSRQTAIGDRREDIAGALSDALERVNHVVVSGGLGPTHDDITSETIAEFLGQKQVMNYDLLARMKERFARAGLAMPKSNERQALVPEHAELIPNPHGTAAGLILRRAHNTIYVVPGVPAEMRAMIVDHVAPRIAASLGADQQETATLMTTGWPESRLYDALAPLMQERDAVHVAFLPARRGVRIRLAAAGDRASEHVTEWIAAVRTLIGETIYAEQEKLLEQVVGERLVEMNATVALAESCTGGLIAKRLTDIAGSSAFFHRAYVVYSNDAKVELLGVDEHALTEFGAVSAEVAKQMAEGARDRASAEFALAVTGIAGPGGGTDSKPVGTVCIAVAGGSPPTGDTIARRLQFGGGRAAIRERAAQAALFMLWRRLNGLL